MKDLNHHRTHLQKKILQRMRKTPESNDSLSQIRGGYMKARPTDDTLFWTAHEEKTQELHERNRIKRVPLIKKHRGILAY